MSENITITINGKPQGDIEFDLVEVIVDTNLFLPAMFTIVVLDHYDKKADKFQYTDSDEVFKIGNEVKIEVETDEIPDESGVVKAVLIIGEITSVEPVFASDGITQLRIRGYDRSHRFTRGTHTRTFGDANPTGSGITDEQIINTIVGETDGVTGKKVDTSGMSGVKYSYVMQYNQSDWEFMWSRARQLGYQVYVEDKTLHFEKADAHRGAANEKPATLTWGLNLGSFEPRLSTMGQLSKVTAKGWDPGTKKAIEGVNSSVTDKNLPDIGFAKKGSALVKEAFSEAEASVIDYPLWTVDQAKVIAHARHMEAESAFVKAEGRCREGDPRLVAGRVVEIENVGIRFSGKYYVTEARHEWLGGQYLVRFNVTCYNSNTLRDLLHAEDEDYARRVFGVVTAKVTNLEDPEALGRVQVMFPWLPKYKDSDLSSNWARLAVPSAGSERGVYFVPEIDDEVLVAFEHGDLSFPYIVGALWNQKDKPPAGTADVLASDKKKVNQRIMRSRTGHVIILDDTEGAEQIIIQDKTESNSITINSSDNSMTIKAGGDLIFEAGGKFVMNSTGDFTLDTKGKGTLTSTMDMGIESKAKASLKGGVTGSLELASTGTTLKGSKVDVTSTSTAALKGTAMVELSGALVKIN
ncbi:MAG: VgrG-related protein [Anaerolineaceae bacterium]|nr:VgrG-related protein [Anaerolineaceae bacterium]